jgi:Flp pilus assembly CpaF family ATPase
MLKGLSEGHAGMTTIHAKDTDAVVRRLCAYAASAPEQLPFPHTESLIPDAIQLVVYLRKVEDFRTGRWYRTVSSIHEVVPQRDERYIRATMSPIFDSKGSGDGRARPTGTRPDHLDELEAAGFEPTLLQRAEGWWN